MAGTDGAFTELGSVPSGSGRETLVMDPVHGQINISEYPVVEELVGTPYFQRLRRLSQLGLASCVYPGATHTRFSHCLGVMKVFFTLFDPVASHSKIDSERVKRLRHVGAAAALLHDLVHGPFSHASEQILDGGKYDHEEMTKSIITGTTVSGILERNNISPRLITYARADCTRLFLPKSVLHEAKEIVGDQII